MKLKEMLQGYRAGARWFACTENGWESVGNTIAQAREGLCIPPQDTIKPGEIDIYRLATAIAVKVFGRNDIYPDTGILSDDIDFLELTAQDLVVLGRCVAYQLKEAEKWSPGTLSRDSGAKYRARQSYKSRISDIKKIWKNIETPQKYNSELSLREYGIEFSYIPAHTYSDQDQGYFSYQLSTGGVSEEFRFFTDFDLNCHNILFCWRDSPHKIEIQVKGKNKELLLKVFKYFKNSGAVETALLNVGGAVSDTNT